MAFSTLYNKNLLRYIYKTWFNGLEGKGNEADVIYGWLLERMIEFEDHP